MGRVAVRADGGGGRLALVQHAIRQPGDELRESYKEAYRDEVGDHEWQCALEDCCERDIAADSADHEAIQADGRRHKADARHLDDDDAEPDRIVPERDHRRIEHGQRQQHHADRVHEHAEDEIDEENADNDHHAVYRQMDDPLGECLGKAGKTEKAYEDKDAPDDREDHHPWA